MTTNPSASSAVQNTARRGATATGPESLAMGRFRVLAVLFVAAALAAGCGGPRKGASVGASKGGGYYLDDGPGSNIPPNIANIPDAVPRIERHNPANFRPYTVLGQRFVPVGADTALRQSGVASWYGRKFHGQKTANGETYDMYAMTAAHPTLPLPSYARVTHARNGRSIIVRVNDRGPFLRGRVIDLSYAAAAKLGIIGHGSDTVVVEAITHADIRSGLNMASAQKTPAAAPKPAPAVRVAAAPAASRATPAPATPAPAPVQTAAPARPATPDALAALDLHATGTAAATGRPPGTAGPADSGRSPVPTVTDNPSEGIYLQFGAFGRYISADQLVNRLNSEIAHVEGRNAHIDTKGELHRVRIGPYPTRTAAVNAAVRIQEATGMQPTLAQR